jgi:SsrA-binding protein
MYISEKGWVKLQIACALGKKLHDKRQDMKEKDAKMEMSRVMKK